MTLEEFKTEASNVTGIPAELLEGENSEEIISRAKMIYALKKNNVKLAPKSTSDQFAEWYKQQDALIYGELTPADIFEGLSNTAKEIDGNQAAFIAPAEEEKPQTTSGMFANWINENNFLR